MLCSIFLMSQAMTLSHTLADAIAMYTSACLYPIVKCTDVVYLKPSNLSKR